MCVCVYVCVCVLCFVLHMQHGLTLCVLNRPSSYFCTISIHNHPILPRATLKMHRVDRCKTAMLCCSIFTHALYLTNHAHCLMNIITLNSRTCKREWRAWCVKKGLNVLRMYSWPWRECESQRKERCSFLASSWKLLLAYSWNLSTWKLRLIRKTSRRP